MCQIGIESWIPWKRGSSPCLDILFQWHSLSWPNLSISLPCCKSTLCTKSQQLLRVRKLCLLGSYEPFMHALFAFFSLYALESRPFASIGAIPPSQKRKSLPLVYPATPLPKRPADTRMYSSRVRVPTPSRFTLLTSATAGGSPRQCCHECCLRLMKLTRLGQLLQAAQGKEMNFATKRSPDSGVCALLPMEVWRQVALHMSTRELAKGLARVSKAFRRLDPDAICLSSFKGADLT